jgi:protoporphyrinogen/coproporphyrinogen III oxidase
VPASKKILIIGGGISGLACAWRLRQMGFDVLLLERSARFGGVIDTVQRDGFRFDVGPQSFLNTAAISKLIEELALGSELVQADPRAPRYILKGGRLLPAPLSPPRFLLTSLLSAKTKLRLLSEPFRHTKPPEREESVAGFVRRKFGEDLLNNLVAPLISGIWAGDPEKLSLTSAFPSLRRSEERYGSVVRGAIKERRQSGGTRARHCSFRKGVSTLTNALARKIGEAAVSGAEIAALHQSSAEQRTTFQVTYSQGGVNRVVEAAAVVSAVPTGAAARLLAPIAGGFGEILAEIEYVAVAQVLAGYRLEQIARRNASSSLAGFGFLVPRAEGLRLLGTVWNSSLFPDCVPRGEAGMASFTSFLGGATDPQICSMNEAEIAAIAHAELASVLGITGAPVAQHVARWERALPQYNIGHARLVRGLEELCARTPGIFLAGNYIAGPSIGACVEQANSVAEAVARFCAASA